MDIPTASCVLAMELFVISNLVNAFAHQTPSHQHVTLANPSPTPTTLNLVVWNAIAIPEVCPTVPTVDVMRIPDSADAVTMSEVYVATSANQATMASLTAPNALVILEEALQTPVTGKLDTASARTTLKDNSATDAKKVLSILMKLTLWDVRNASALEYLMSAMSHSIHPLKSTT